jgi:2-polyprenyl-6-methoxyphenol hydroxylase-like FAD-dependent oxidoreductase
LTLALCHHAAGLDVQVFEAASRIDALGLGINLQPNAVGELTELGLASNSRDCDIAAIQARRVSWLSASAASRMLA